MHEKAELRQTIRDFFAMESGETDVFESFFQPIVLQKGDYLLRSGHYQHALSFVQSGFLRMYVQEGEKEITQWISSAGTFCTDLAGLVFDQPARWNIQALSEVQLLSIDRERYRQLGNFIPKWHELEKLFIAKCFTQLEERVYGHLSKTAEERYRLFQQYQPEVFNQVPQQYLASMLGMTAETFSRIRKKNSAAIS